MPNRRGARSSVSRDRAYNFPRVAAVLVFAAALLLIQYRHSPLIVAATTHQPEPYTELYFTHPTQLPSIAASSGVLPLNFTVHNLEGRAVDYTYTVVFAPAGHAPSTLEERRLAIANNVAAVRNDQVHLPAFRGRAEITVSLSGKPEAIHFWVESET